MLTAAAAHLDAVLIPQGNDMIMLDKLLHLQRPKSRMCKLKPRQQRLATTQQQQVAYSSDLWRCSSADAQLAVRYLLAIGQAHMLQVAQQGRVRDLQPDALHPSSSSGHNAHTTRNHGAPCLSGSVNAGGLAVDRSHIRSLHGVEPLQPQRHLLQILREPPDIANALN